MKVLIIGAGVIGSLFAGRLQISGHEVVMLARGIRLEQIRTQGLVFEDQKTEIKNVLKVQVVDQINQNDHFELAIISVRKNQIHEIIPTLALCKNISNFLFMINNALGFEEYCQALGRERILFGFPGAGGKRSFDGTVTYRILPAPIQATQIGEMDGSTTPRLLEIAAMLRNAGFPTNIQNNMDAWLKTHVALVSPIANAIYLAGGKANRLAETRDGLIMMIRAIREGFHVLHHLSIPIVPRKLKLIWFVPESILIILLSILLKLPIAELILAQHARSARDEMRQIALEFQQLILRARVPTININNLIWYMDAHVEPLPVGSKTIKVCRQDWTIVVMVVFGFLLGGLLMYKHRKR